MKHIFNGHSDYQTQVYKDEQNGADIWVVRYEREKSNRLKSAPTSRRRQWEEFQINFDEIPFVSHDLRSKLKSILTAIAMKVVPETFLIYKKNIFSALIKMEVDGIIFINGDQISSDAILAYWDRCSG
ncbi:hypothetical protein [Zhongshania aliphaticivorans]|uniref:hypothetical protein n=1 Tax=Zhongshania aliphaticivorans TaxID=1470434 RepID=UPI0012E44F9D|nr:hypothetical protein [Zhongshania aliphaticivorans]CAA0118843.1 Uncharacterised protein [Zhongshania aliphaticivorans]